MNFFLSAKLARRGLRVAFLGQGNATAVPFENGLLFAFLGQGNATAVPFENGLLFAFLCSHPIDLNIQIIRYSSQNLPDRFEYSDNQI